MRTVRKATQEEAIKRGEAIMQNAVLQYDCMGSGELLYHKEILDALLKERGL